MNKARRNTIKEVIEMLDLCETKIDQVSDEEYDAMLAVPENLQNTDRYSKMEETAEDLRDITVDILDLIADVKERLGDV